ncbi:AraC-like ligand-binding domain-containing protein [Subtercola frigoramans]|uniref:AraC-like DNA-binding protein n=1 Tax=Subtercola frigoramans TaxID=120298 RepID=A0ABS2L8G9_9MICO|nr:helix-turn-helix domain-containing protein [Subtercola frigoramans]MBM7473387.1 AraC-like DNA-binding protein [Subtercola frigoramans]
MALANRSDEWQVRLPATNVGSSKRFTMTVDVKPRDEQTFAAEFIWSRVGVIEVMTLTAPTHRGARTAKLIEADPRDFISLVYISEGSMSVYQDGRSALLQPGTLFFLRSQSTYRYAVTGRTEIVAVALPSSLLPFVVSKDMRNITAIALPDSMLNSSAMGLVDALVRTRRTPSIDELLQLERELLLLLVGLISENFGEVTISGSSDRALFSRAAVIIAANAFAPGYGPVDVAAELGIEVRRLYRIFRTESVSIAELIRDTRLQRVALVLSDPLNRDLLADIAVKFGFLGADQCARAFRRKYGQSMRAYRVLSRP